MTKRTTYCRDQVFGGPGLALFTTGSSLSSFSPSLFSPVAVCGANMRGNWSD